MKDSDIKKLWNQDIAPDVQGIEKELIEKSIREGSINVIDRFVKTLKVELWINLVSLTALTLILSYRAYWFSAFSF